MNRLPIILLFITGCAPLPELFLASGAYENKTGTLCLDLDLDAGEVMFHEADGTKAITYLGPSRGVWTGGPDSLVVEERSASILPPLSAWLDAPPQWQPEAGTLSIRPGVELNYRFSAMHGELQRAGSHHWDSVTDCE